MRLNKYVIQLCYSGVNWVFLILLKYLLVSDEYSSFMYFFVYSHATAGILNYIFAYKLLKKDYKSTYATESLMFLLLLGSILVAVSLIYSVWFLVFSVSFSIKELYFRDVIKSGKDFSIVPVVTYLFSFSVCSALIYLKNFSKDNVFVILTVTNLVFSYPLILKIRFKVDNWPKLSWDDISMPLLGSSKNILISEVLMKGLNPLGYGEFYHVRNLLGPLGQVSNLINVGVSGKGDNTPKKIIHIVRIMYLTIWFTSIGFLFSKFQITLGAIIFALWETLFGIVSFRIYVDGNLLKLGASHVLILTIIYLGYIGLSWSLYTALIIFLMLSSIALSYYFINREA